MNTINIEYIDNKALEQFESYCKLNHTDITVHNYRFGLITFRKYLKIPVSQLKKNNIIEIYTNIIKDSSRNLAYLVKSSIKKYFEFVNDTYNLELNNNILNIKIQGWVMKKKLPATTSDTTLEIIEKLKSFKNSFSNKRNILAILILATTGIRRKELYNIQVADIDLENDFIFIRHPKGEKKTRSVLIADIVKEKLISYLNEREKIANIDTDLLFISKFGNALTINGFTRIIRRLAEKTNINFTFHSFRRGLATELYNQNNVRVSDIANILGHSNIDCTVKHYIQIDKTKINDILNRHNLYKIKSKNIGYFSDIKKELENKEKINLNNNIL